MKRITMRLSLVRETNTCYVYGRGSRNANDLLTIYLKKRDVQSAGIVPTNGIVITIEEDAPNE